VQIESPTGAYFVMQLFVGEPLFLATGHAVDLRVVDYIKSIEFAGTFYSQIESALRRSQLIIFVICGAIAFLMLLAAVWLAILFATRLTEPIGGLMSAAERPDRMTQGQVEILQRGARQILLVRISAATGAGFVVTFDDVTDLMSAQRMAAWGDVARRIAHEIKNPLTPIQLSAERLKRRYLKQIKEDPETFSICTDTIIRQVGDIGRMVDEFSSFARMPRPTVQAEDAKELCQQALFLQRNGNPDIRYASHLPAQPVALNCDRRQVSQVLTNILKNSAEAIEGREAKGDAPLPPGEISLTLADDGGTVRIVIEDNGKGLPTEGRERLTEPYMTTRTKGTGLGLAIVKKIMEDHGGFLSLEDREGGGARISLVFRRDAKEIASASPHATAAQ
jgi:two-component system nitrogen regulation sensor histidine kinase NtrY